ncbi:MAG TPA: hypothetical protein VN176_14890 [Verrucomicrobiae bacterium]|jgi:hypothetical protein|nr:hypothetical protein [Verrucomicrobiae bacterium]
MTSIVKPFSAIKKPAPLLCAVLISVSFAPGLVGQAKSLWPGARYTDQDREQALERGLQFIGHVASDPEYFVHKGYDLLWCFYTISNTARSEKLRGMAREMGQEYARRWRHGHPDPPTADAVDLFNFVSGTNAADLLLGDSDPMIRLRIQEAVSRFSALDFLAFDPRIEPPPSDIPLSCEHCTRREARHAPCPKCTSKDFRSKYDVWLDALIVTYFGKLYGVELGATYEDVLRWISVMRPYPSPSKLDEDNFHDVVYAITHVVYTLDDYESYSLSPKGLPQEYAYLKHNIRRAMRYGDGEILGEFLDTLRAFGRDENDPDMRAGINYLLSHQNADGSWGDPDEEDFYTRYHATWTAIDGLREYAFHGERTDFPSVLPRPGEKHVK